MIPPAQQTAKAVPNQVEHRARFRERKAAGLVQTNPPSGLAAPSPPIVQVQRPNPADQARGGRMTLAEQLGLARAQQAAGGAVAVTGNAALDPRTSQAVVPEQQQQQQRNPAETITPEAPVLPPRPAAAAPQQAVSPPPQQPDQQRNLPPSPPATPAQPTADMQGLASPPATGDSAPPSPATQQGGGEEDPLA